MIISPLRKWSLVVLSLVEILFFGGLILGWAPLLFILKQENFFGDLCPHGDNASGHKVSAINYTFEQESRSCVVQDERLNLIFTICFALCMTFCFVSGHLQYKFGRKKLRIASLIAIVGAFLIIGFSPKEVPWLLVPGLFFMAIAGYSLLMSNMQVSMLLPKGGVVYVCVLNGCFDSSVVTMIIVKHLYEHGVKKAYSFVGMAVLATVISGLTTVLHLSNEMLNDNINGKVTVEISKLTESLDDHEQRQEERKLKEVGWELEEKKKSLCRTIFSRVYMLHMLWLCTTTLPTIYFIGSINNTMEQVLRDIKKVSYLTDVLTYMMLAGAVFSMCTGIFIRWQTRFFSSSTKKILPLSITSTLAALLACIMYAASEEWLYVSFVACCLLRAFVWGVNMDFIIDRFPEVYINVLQGFSMTFVGLFSMLQYALFVWKNSYDHAFKHVNAFLICGACLSFLHPLSIAIQARYVKH